jgi:integrase
MRAICKLTTPLVATLIRNGADGRWGDGGGLYLQIRFGTPSWVFRDYVDGRERWTGLGSARFVSLLEARRGALSNHKSKHDGQDHRAARAQRRTGVERQAVTFADMVDQFIKAKAAQFKGNGVQKWRGPLANHALPVLGKTPVAFIDTPDVLKVLTPIWGSAIGEHVRQRISAVLDFASAQKLRSGENPARWKGHLKHLLAPKIESEHHAAMAIDDVPAFVQKLRALNDVPARAFEFLVLTCLRQDEIRGADWSEIDLKTKTWTVPAERMKTKVEHRVPLSDRAIEILQAQRPKATGLVFPSAITRGKIHKNKFGEIIRDLGFSGTPHGFRSTFSDWSQDRTTHPRDIAQKALAHVVGDKTERAYQRTDLFDRRKPLMAAWAKFCGEPTPKLGSNVVPLAA